MALLKAFEVGHSDVLPPARHVQIPKTAGDILIKNHTPCIFLKFKSVYPKPRAGWFVFGGFVCLFTFVPTSLTQGS